MVFSSITFLVFFLPVVLLVFLLLPLRFRNVFLLLASVFFYSWGAPRFIFVMLLTTLADFLCVNKLYSAQANSQRKLWLFFSVSINVLILFYFKYSNFFIENIGVFAEKLGFNHPGVLEVVLPIGISFYTFESITYTVDVYRRVHKPLDSFADYLLYIIFFPKLIAGPIIRYHELADQLPVKNRSPHAQIWLSGFIRFTIGLLKKVFIANTMAVIADEIFLTPPGLLSSAKAWLGMLCYTFQIYFDFSGYSDMAIGLGRMFGFSFPENFDHPYSSGSITEFWRRWHMSLGRWMKNYLYIPLGGNRSDNRSRTWLNLWLVFILSGLWHGAAWNFIVWGLFHGFFLVLERAGLQKIYDRVGRAVSIPVSFLIVCFGWVFFRSENLNYAVDFISCLFSFDKFDINSFFSPHFTFFFIAAFLFSFFRLFPGGTKLESYLFHSQHGYSTVTISVLCCIGVFLGVATLASSEFNPFIYFRF